MPLYELGVILDPEVSPEDETGALERLEKIISDAGGSVVDKDSWGRRQLAYPIKKHGFGIYHFWRFDVTGEVLKDLNFELRTNDLFLRHLTLNLDREMRRHRKGERKQQEVAAKKAAKAEAAAIAADVEQ